MKEKQRAIFLDLDGVCNNTSSMYMAMRGIRTPDNCRPTLHTVDHTCVLLLQYLVKEKGLCIVLTSTWRKLSNGVEEFLIAFKWAGFTDIETYFIGCTPIHSYGIRGDEIKIWLDNHPEITEYIIFDDDSDMLDEQKPHFIHVDGNYGLQPDHIELALSYFNKQKENENVEVV